MFLFSKKLFFLMVVVSVLFGGERNSAAAAGKFNMCHQCKGDGGTHDTPPYCDADHSGGELGKYCFLSYSDACFMRKDSNGLISKGCEHDRRKWKDANGNPKCITNQECYCNDKDFCNRDKNFGGLIGGTGFPEAGGGPGSPGTGGGTGGSAGNSGSIGTKDMFRGISIFFGMMADVAQQ
ncbi:unnamed protein product [Orchesella dallaii]|uniref:Uncharacterized protein n=1 Tax=Orchesella dallaii TaxID=48710 RepID=A0ABP1RZ18_9HEXA